jgi:hypothetical protein
MADNFQVKDASGIVISRRALDVGSGLLADVVSQGPLAPSGKTPVTGTFTAIGQSAAFEPLAGRDFNIQLTGPFVATVALEMSLDGGTTYSPVMVDDTQLGRFTVPGMRSWSASEVGARFRLACTAFASGTVTYRISQ